MNLFVLWFHLSNSLHQPFEGGVTIEKDQYKSEPEKSTLESVLQLNIGRWSLHAEEPCPTVISDTTEAPVQTDIIRQPSPPPVLADVHDLMSITSTQVTDLTSGPENSFQDELVCHEPPSQLHIVRFCRFFYLNYCQFFFLSTEFLQGRIIRI